MLHTCAWIPYTECVLRFARFSAVALLALAPGLLVPLPTRSAEGAAPGTPSFATALRYIGRDPLTGLPTRVDDRFIAEAELAIERYGEDAREPVPPPPPGAVDISAISIPALNILKAEVRRYGLDAYGRLDVPQDTTTVGWNPAFTSLPGSGGSTFLAAHFEYGGRPGIFHRLATLRPGDTVVVRLTDGSEHHYRVLSVVDYALGAIDMGAILRGLEGRESLALMTCSGPANEGEYAYRTVVLAERVSP
jgi:sortase (surface protein transpeptidase)